MPATMEGTTLESATTEQETVAEDIEASTELVALRDLSLDDSDGEGVSLKEVTLKPSLHKYPLCIVCKIWGDREVNLSGVKRTMAIAWKPGRAMIVKELGDGRYLLRSHHEVRSATDHEGGTVEL